ncbi:hypothetical protein D3C72_1594640 [compost metagenome]
MRVDHGLVAPLQLGHGGSAQALRGQLAGQRLQPVQGFERGAQFVQVQRRNPVANVLPVQHQPFGHQHLERLAQRRLGNVEGLAEGPFVDARAGRQFALFDHRAQPGGDFGRHAERAQARGFGKRLCHRRHLKGEMHHAKATTHRNCSCATY